jgi:hypothetical protein
VKAIRALEGVQLRMCRDLCECCVLAPQRMQCMHAGEAQELHRRLTPEEKAMTAISQILSRAVPSAGAEEQQATSHVRASRCHMHGCLHLCPCPKVCLQH